MSRRFDSRLEALVRDFERSGAQELEAELRFHGAQPDPRTALAVAATWRGARGKIHVRQRRMPRVVKQAAGRALQRMRISEAHTFEALLRKVREAIGAVRGIGEVTIYDAALRIGAQRGLLPTRVRLHSAARESALLLGLEVGRKSWLDVEAFPRALRAFHSWEIERFLSTHREALAGLAQPNRRASFSVALAPYLLARAPRGAA